MISLGLGLNRGVAPVWKPSKIPGLGIWLDAKKLPLGNGDAVASWTDLSGNGFSPAQSTNTKKPTFVVDAINGQPALQFDGVDDELVTGSIALLSSCPGGTIFIVSQNTGAPSDVARTMGVMNGSATGSFRLGVNQRGFPISYDSAGGRRLNTDTAQVTLDNPGYNSTPRILRLAANWQGARFEKWINGQFIIAIDPFQTPGLSDSSPSFLTINASGNPANIKIAEILIYNRFLSTAEVASVENYLSRKYSISLS